MFTIWFARRLRSMLFFFQAEDGIRDLIVTGVQTCALPILIAVQPLLNRWLARHRPEHGYPAATVVVPFGVSVYGGYFGAAQGVPFLAAMEIGRASCRERV